MEKVENKVQHRYIKALIAGRDLDEKCLIRFFSKQINCSCLTARYNQAKMCPPSKRGVCENCNENRERKSLMICAISGHVIYQ